MLLPSQAGALGLPLGALPRKSRAEILQWLRRPLHAKIARH